MEIDKCKNCKYCTIANEETKDGEYLTLYCWRPTKYCPYEKINT